MTASNVRYTSSGPQLLLDAVKRGYPILVYIGLITGSKEPLYSAKKAVVMPSPRQTRAGPKTLGDKWLIDDGLKAGDRVIVEGVQKVKPGSDAQPTEAGTAPAAR